MASTRKTSRYYGTAYREGRCDCTRERERTGTQEEEADAEEKSSKDNDPKGVRLTWRKKRGGVDVGRACSRSKRRHFEKTAAP